jgi:hypothetical protein
VIIPKADYHFAKKYTTRELLTDESKARAFEDEFLQSEAAYFDACHDPRTGLVYDGLNLDPRTGQAASLRNWSAPSKECLDLGLLIKALQGDVRAVKVVGQGDVAAARAEAVQLLEQKLSAYEEFQRQNPGYAGFLPWYYINQDQTVATPDWEGKIPGLDNGEWMWTMLVAEKSLRDSGFSELAGKYQAYNQQLQDNVTRVFYDPQGVACRGDVRILEPDNPNTGYEALNPGSFMTGEHGVHEGCMLIHYLSLFGKELPAGAVDKIWDDIQMKRVETRHGTTWQGFWGSAHESWAYLFMPFRDHQGYQDLFRIREEIRTQNAVERGYPGLATSTNGPRGGYLSDAGIEGVGSQPVHSNDTFAVYGAFPLLLQFAQHSGPGNYALAWLHNMLAAPRMQGPLGGGESGTNDGTAFSAMKTTDGTHPSLLGMMGGLERETADLLREKGVYQKFLERIDGEYRETFGSRPLREPNTFAAPSMQVPHQELGDYILN